MSNRFAVPSLIVFLVGLILLLESSQGYAQRGGQFKFGGPPGGFKGGFKGDFKFDPARIFDFIAKGKNYFEIKDTFRDRDVLELFAKQNNITDGKITRDQFVKYWDQRNKLREEIQKNGGGSADGGGKGKGKGGFDPEAQFKRMDTNGDGFLNEDEISQSRRLKDEWQKWDTNKDGRLSLDEYKAYAEARARERDARRDEKKDGDKKDDKKDEKKDEKKESITRQEYEELENVRPVVYYAGNLPKEGMPPWFTELDANKDGQVSLMEWMKGGKSMSDFAKWDHNDDGLITPEEALRQQRLESGAGGGEKVAGGPNGNGGGPRAFPGAGKGPRMFNKGGQGGNKDWMNRKKGRKRPQ